MKTVKLWNQKESAGTGNPADDFEPYFETYMLDSAQPRAAAGSSSAPAGGLLCRAPHE
jgi:hypothetical protein